MNDARFPLSISPDGSITLDTTDAEATLSLIRAICSTFIGEHPIETRMGISDAVLQNVTPAELVSSVENSLGEYVESEYEVFASINEERTAVTILYEGQDSEIVLRTHTLS